AEVRAVRQSDPSGPAMLIVSGRAAAHGTGGTVSQDQIDALVARLTSDPAFAASLTVAPTPEDAQRIAAEHGFDVTPGELAAASPNRDLSDADLEAVSGGTAGRLPPATFFGCVGGGGGGGGVGGSGGLD
ncbi:MAG: Nif11-like leader peptide family RiPP precursor, partial [Actinobacteria bacterium]|nr:Nif11-like leader peptide family RiPP precursor [Actinomycetota bacterium]